MFTNMIIQICIKHSGKTRAINPAIHYRQFAQPISYNPRHNPYHWPPVDCEVYCICRFEPKQYCK